MLSERVVLRASSKPARTECPLHLEKPEGPRRGTDQCAPGAGAGRGLAAGPVAGAS